jgi:hypothetical protein
MNWYITKSAYSFPNWTCVSTADDYMQYNYIEN